MAGVPRPLHSKESLRWVTEKFSYSTEHITEDWINVRYEVGRLPKTVLAVEKMAELISAVLLPHLARQKEETHRWIREGRLKTPTLLVWGKNDPSAAISGGAALFDMVATSAARAQMHIFNQAGHYSYREHPQDFVRVIIDFIEASRS